MVTGMKKKNKITEIFFDEQSPVINIRTYNTDLKNRLTRFSIEYPDECKLVDDSGNGMLAFEINKGRFFFRLTLIQQRDLTIPLPSRIYLTSGTQRTPAKRYAMFSKTKVIQESH